MLALLADCGHDILKMKVDDWSLSEENKYYRNR